MCSSDIPGPDPRIGEAALRSAELGKEAFDWYKQYFDTTLGPQQRELADLNAQVTKQQMATAQEQQRIASETYDYQKGTFRPVEQALVDEAMAFNTRDQAERKAAQAAADVQAAYGQVEGEVNRDLGRRGVSLSAGQLAANKNALALSKAANVAGASNAARDQAEALGWARKVDAASLGRGLANQQATAAQIALSGGSQASQVAGSTGQSARANAGIMGDGYSAALQATGQAGNLFAEQSRQNQYAAANSGSDILGTVAGVGTRYALGKVWG